METQNLKTVYVGEVDSYTLKYILSRSTLPKKEAKEIYLKVACGDLQEAKIPIKGGEVILYNINNNINPYIQVRILVSLKDAND